MYCKLMFKLTLPNLNKLSAKLNTIGTQDNIIKPDRELLNCSNKLLPNTDLTSQQQN